MRLKSLRCLLLGHEWALESMLSDFERPYSYYCERCGLLVMVW